MIVKYRSTIFKYKLLPKPIQNIAPNWVQEIVKKKTKTPPVIIEDFMEVDSINAALKNIKRLNGRWSRSSIVGTCTGTQCHYEIIKIKEFEL